MAEAQLIPAPAIPAGPVEAAGKVKLAPRTGLTLLHVAARRGKTGALVEAVRAVYAVEPPLKPRLAEGRNVAFAWAGPDQWLAIAEERGAPVLERELKAATSGLASIANQSDGRTVIAVSGPLARDLLSKHLPIDLHSRAFKPGDVALTYASHVGVILWQTDAAPTFELACTRSFADTLWRWLVQAGAEYGLGRSDR